MVGAGVEPPAPPSSAAARLMARGVRPRRISAKRSWPPGCGRVPAPPPPTAAAGDGGKGADGRADEAVAPAAVPPAAQNGAPHQQGKDKVEEAAARASIPPAAQNGAPHQQGKDKVEEAAAPASVPPAAQNGTPHQQGKDKVEEAAALAAVPPVAQKGAPDHLGQNKVEKAAALTVVPPAAQKGAPDHPGQNKVEVAALSVAVPPTAQNSALPQQGQDKVEKAAVSLAAQNSAPTQQGQDKVVEAVAVVAVPSEKCDGIISHALPQQGQEATGEEGDRGENGEAGSLINGADAASLEGQEGNRTVQVEVPVLSAPDSGIAGPGTSAQNSGKGADLLLAEDDHDGSGGVMLDEVSGDGYDREMRNRTDGGEIERNMDVVQGSRKKRWLMSAVNPPPKRRAVSAVRRFPPGCGRAAITTKGSGVSKISAIRTFPPGCERADVATDGSGVLEVSPVRAFPPDGGRVAVTPDGCAILEVSPIRSYPPGCGRAAVTTIGSGDEERIPVGATPVANGDASVTEALAAVPISGGAVSEKVEGKRLVGEGSSKAHNKIQQSQVASYISPADIVGANQGSEQLPNFVTKVLPKHGFAEKMKGNISTLEGKLDGSLRKDLSKTPTSRAIGANANGKRSYGDNMNVTLLDNAKASGEKNMQRKTLSTKKELVHSNVNMKKDKFALKVKGDGISKMTSPRSTESKKGKHVATNQIEENDEMDLVPDQIIVQALMAPDKCPWTQRKRSIVSASKSLAPQKRSKGKDAAPRKQLSLEVVSSELINDETIDDNEDPYVEDEENSRALTLYDEKREETEFTANLLPSVPSGSHHGQSGGDDVDARRKVRKLLQKFQLLCRKFMQVEEQGTRKVGRIDIAASNTLKKDPTYTKPDPILGSVPGVEVGDEFHFRVELSIIGLHRPIQPGIDSTTINGVPVAISIVASGGYPDELSSSDELIYTGSGGKAAGKKEAEDQKLVRGNLALKNCIEAKTPVRVIHGFKGQSSGEVAHSKAKQVSTFTYDGLYNVVECWQQGPKGSMVFKYRLRRIPGQPQLALHLVKVTKKSKVREGLLLADISEGEERIPICVINTIDGLMPAPFKYVTKIIYPPWYKKEPPTGCDCTNGCSDSVKCACAVKNGGEIPYNFNGAIVEAKPLIYECGPSCRCPPTCHNRVSQHGVKIPLEIFKTGNRGWGVRSLSSIPSGSFICEYAGELLQDKEAEKRANDEYLFDIGHNYHDEELWEGLKSTPGLESSAPSSKPMEGFTIDAAECGNVGRFINHSCSPNLYAQNVLWDHDDVQKPHVMLFAVENIPPLQELTYHYNYTIGQVEDKNGEEKVKHCYCGSAECCGRLY